MKYWGVLAGLLVAALIIVGLEYGLPWWQARSSEHVDVSEVSVSPSRAEQAGLDQPVEAVFEPRPIPPELPALDQSDDEVTAALVDWPADASWLQQGDLLRRLAALIDNAALGEVPRTQLAFLLPEQGFSVTNTGGELRMSPRSVARFNGYLDLLEAYPVEQSAAFLMLYAPLLDAALRELGRPDADSLALVRRSARNVLGVSMPDAGLELKRTERGFAFADEEIEAASELEKQLLRLGPDNLGRLQRYARALVAQLEVLERGSS